MDIMDEQITWTDRINAEIVFLNRLAKGATTNRNGGTIVYAADAALIAAIVKDRENLITRIPKKKADYES